MDTMPPRLTRASASKTEITNSQEANFQTKKRKINQLLPTENSFPRTLRRRKHDDLSSTLPSPQARTRNLRSKKSLSCSSNQICHETATTNADNLKSEDDNQKVEKCNPLDHCNSDFSKVLNKGDRTFYGNESSSCKTSSKELPASNSEIISTSDQENAQCDVSSNNVFPSNIGSNVEYSIGMSRKDASPSRTDIKNKLLNDSLEDNTNILNISKIEKSLNEVSGKEKVQNMSAAAEKHATTVSNANSNQDPVKTILVTQGVADTEIPKPIPNNFKLSYLCKEEVNSPLHLVSNNIFLHDSLENKNLTENSNGNETSQCPTDHANFSPIDGRNENSPLGPSSVSSLPSSSTISPSLTSPKDTSTVNEGQVCNAADKSSDDLPVSTLEKDEESKTSADQEIHDNDLSAQDNVPKILSTEKYKKPSIPALAHKACAADQLSECCQNNATLAKDDVTASSLEKPITNRSTIDLNILPVKKELPVLMVPDTRTKVSLFYFSLKLFLF